MPTDERQPNASHVRATPLVVGSRNAQCHSGPVSRRVAPGVAASGGAIVGGLVRRSEAA